MITPPPPPPRHLLLLTTPYSLLLLTTPYYSLLWRLSPPGEMIIPLATIVEYPLCFSSLDYPHLLTPTEADAKRGELPWLPPRSWLCSLPWLSPLPMSSTYGLPTRTYPRRARPAR